MLVTVPGNQPSRGARHSQRQRPTLTIINRLEGWPARPGTNSAGSRRTAPGRVNVNICQHPAKSPLEQNDRLLALIGSAGIHSGIHDKADSSRHCLAYFAQRFTHDFHAGAVCKGCRGTRPGTRYRYAFWRWCWTSSRLWFALRFATLCANLPCEPGRPACYQKLWFPGGGFHCGFQRIAGVRWPPCRSG